MKIGIDARLYGETGIGRYIKNLISQLEKLDNENDYILFMNNEGSKAYHPVNPRFKKWLVNVKWYTAEEQVLMLKEFYQARLDLLHVPHFNIPVLYPKKMVVTLHDLTMSESDSSSTLKKAGYDGIMKMITMKASKVIVPSNSVADEVSSKMGIPKSKIAVTYEAADEALIKLAPTDIGVMRTRLEEMRINSSYFLYVGNAYQHKNLNSLIVSYKELLKEQDFGNVQLVIAGGRDIYAERLAGFSHALGLDTKIIFVAKYSDSKFISEKDLAYLYKGATAYVFPSMKEGFSITPLEAQSLGIPVLISDISVHHEVFGESAMYFNPKSNLDLSEKMLMIYRDPDLRAKLIAAGYENCKKYSWSKMGQETLNVYKEVLKI